MLGKVYKICSPHTEKIYIGSTFRTLERRFSDHTACSNKTSSKLILAMGDAFIELLDEVQVLDKNELRDIEQQYLELYKDIAVNKSSAYGLDQAKKKAKEIEYYKANKVREKAKDAEYYKANKVRFAEYYQANKDRKKAWNVEYYQANKDRIAEYRKINGFKIPCICGTSVTKTNMPRHIKTLKHKNYIAKQ